MKTMKVGVAGALGLVAMAIGVVPAAAESGSGNDDVIREGVCSAGSDWKLKAGLDDGQIDGEFEVDQNVVGDVWRVVIKDNGTEIFRTRTTTVAPSGSFEVDFRGANLEGNDRIVATARNLETGEVCRGVVTVRA